MVHGGAEVLIPLQEVLEVQYQHGCRGIVAGAANLGKDKGNIWSRLWPFYTLPYFLKSISPIWKYLCYFMHYICGQTFILTHEHECNNYFGHKLIELTSTWMLPVDERKLVEIFRNNPGATKTQPCHELETSETLRFTWPWSEWVSTKKKLLFHQRHFQVEWTS